MTDDTQSLRVGALNQSSLRGEREVSIKFLYTNWEGRQAFREARPVSVRFGTTEWHPVPQWLLLAFDTDKQAEREFAMQDMQFDPDDWPAFALRGERVQAGAVSADDCTCDVVCQDHHNCRYRFEVPSDRKSGLVTPPERPTCNHDGVNSERLPDWSPGPTHTGNLARPVSGE